MLSIEFLGHTLGLVGTVMISYTAIAVHHRVWKEHKIDDKVFRSMKTERTIGVLGIVFIILGYLLLFPSRFL